MDGLVYDEFIECVRTGRPCPIDVYDAVSWMAVTALSEQSIAMGGAPVAIPGSREGDINGNCCASSAVVTSIYHALNLSEYMVPMFTEDDLKTFLDIIEKREKDYFAGKAES